MNAKTILVLVILLMSVFLIGCTQSGYAAYNAQQPQQQAVGGGCGVASQAAYEGTPVADALNTAQSA